MLKESLESNSSGYTVVIRWGENCDKVIRLPIIPEKGDVVDVGDKLEWIVHHRRFFINTPRVVEVHLE